MLVLAYNFINFERHFLDKLQKIFSNLKKNCLPKRVNEGTLPVDSSPVTARQSNRKFWKSCFSSVGLSKQFHQFLGTPFRTKTG